MNNIVFGFILGSLATLVYMFLRDKVCEINSKKESSSVYVSSKLNRPGTRIPMNSTTDVIIWMDEGEENCKY